MEFNVAWYNTQMISDKPTVSPEDGHILLLQLWHGCQVCVKISAQLPPEASTI